MHTGEELLSRFDRAKALGWLIEDCLLTPGVPRLGVRRPDGEIAGIGHPLTSQFTDRLWDDLDRLGVP